MEEGGVGAKPRRKRDNQKFLMITFDDDSISRRIVKVIAKI